ncbi:hypothetical protein BH09PSE1_BH09PSE1_02200 [soil metagenome]
MLDESSLEALLQRDFRWPRPGDTPFVQAEQWQDNAYIDGHGHGRLTMMMSGDMIP